jgi:hypothetical protein
VSRFPTIADVVAWLRSEEQPGMALAVERLKQQHERLVNANQRTVDEYNALLQKHEPQRREYGPVWTGD